MQNKLFSGFFSVILLLLTLFFVNGITKNLSHGIFFDLSEEKLFSLSSGSKGVIDKLQDPVTLKYFFSKTDSSDFPALKIYNDRVLGLLKQYERHSNSKIKIEVYDPRPDSDEADWASKYGLQDIQLQTGESVYFGLTGISSSGKEKSIPAFDINNQEALEYELTKLIYSITENSKSKISILSSLDIRRLSMQQNAGNQGRRPEPWFFVSQISEIAEVDFLEPTTESIPDSSNLLVLIHPKNLSEKTLFAIDQFVLSGKSLIVLVDPFCESDFPAEPTQESLQGYDNSSDLKQLFDKWGVELVKDKILVDREYAASVRLSQTSPQEEFLPWLALNENALSDSDVVINSLERLFFPFAGALKISDDTSLKSNAEVLIQSSNRGHLIDKAEVNKPDLRPKDFAGKYLGKGTEEVIALRISGEIETAFPSGLKEDSSKLQSIEQLKTGKNSNILIFSDVDFISDRSSVSFQNNFFGGQVAVKLNDNLPLLLNSIDNMSGSSDLISIRSRGKVARTFTKVEELEKEARARWFAQENLFKTKLAAANQRLENFQKQAGEESQLFSSALVEEMDKLRKEKAEAQTNLRKVRRNLREDIENLGTRLFLINSIFLPLLVGIFFSIYLFFKPKKKIKL